MDQLVNRSNQGRFHIPQGAASRVGLAILLALTSASLIILFTSTNPEQRARATETIRHVLDTLPRLANLNQTHNGNE